MIHIVGMVGGEAFGRAANDALANADVVVGSPRQLANLPLAPKDTIELTGAYSAVFDRIADRSDTVVIIASGDPGFFGLTRVAVERFGPAAITVHAAPSSISLAFARLGLHWDDATVVSAHGRPLDDAVRAIGTARKVAILTSPDNPPQVVAKAVLDSRPDLDDAAVVTRIGEPAASVTRGTLSEIASGTFDAMSVVVLQQPGLTSDGMGVGHATNATRFGQPIAAFDHRDSMITKPEVRAVVLSKLALPSTGVLWDVGAGSGSVAVEAASLAPGLRVIAIERNAEDATQIERNAQRHNVRVEVVVGEAPAAYDGLPTPDRVFVGGGGIDALRAALDRLASGGVAVATFALADRAIEAHGLLGNLTQITVNRAKPLGDGVHLVAENPVFVAWTE